MVGQRTAARRARRLRTVGATFLSFPPPAPALTFSSGESTLDVMDAPLHVTVIPDRFSLTCCMSRSALTPTVSISRIYRAGPGHEVRDVGETAALLASSGQPQQP